ncbi:MAG: hypothetical protein D6766_10970, partial [Verrucomicrobia bacterium]
GGPVQACLEWPNYCAAWGWLPWVVLAVDRALGEGERAVWVAGLAGAVQFLCGVPELVLLTGLACGLLVVWHLWGGEAAASRRVGETGWRRRVWVRAGWVVVLMAGLTAMQWLPFLELLGWSQRIGGVRDTRWALPASGLANYLLPLAGHEPSVSGLWFRADQQFLRSLYPGLGTWFLAALACRKPWPQSLWAAMGLGCVGMGLALALWPTPGPWIRYPVKCALLAHFGLALLAAGGVARALAEPAGGSRPGRVGLATGLLLAGLGCVVELDGGLSAMTRNVGGRLLFFLAFVALWGWACHGGGRRVSAGAMAAALCGLLWLDLRFHLPGLHPTLPAGHLRPGLYAAGEKPRWGEGRILIPYGANVRLSYEQMASLQDAYLGRRLALWSNANLLEGVPKVGGAMTLRSRWTEEVGRLAQHGGRRAEGLRDFLGVVETNRLDNPTEFGRRATAMPLVTGGQQPVWANGEESRRRLTEAGFDPRRQVVLLARDQAMAPAALRQGGGAVEIGAVEIDRERLRCEVTASEPGGWVVIAQSWHPGWRARVNGRETPIWRANHAFQAIPVPAGRSELRLEFRDSPAWWGLGISLASALVWLGGWTRRGKGRPAGRGDGADPGQADLSRTKRGGFL